jgi:ferredoxin
MCNLCIIACPTDAIKMAQTFEHSVFDRSELTKILNKTGVKNQGWSRIMSGSTVIFYLLAALNPGSGVLSVSTRHIFRGRHLPAVHLNRHCRYLFLA